MAEMSVQTNPEMMAMHGHSPGVALRSLAIGLTAFLTVVDLFATQAILPSLTRHYHVTPAAMGFAVNATTMGMAGDDVPIDPLLLPVGADVMDLVYRPGETTWVRAARAHGHRAQDGLPMLVEQGALACECWFGTPADRGAMWGAVRGA